MEEQARTADHPRKLRWCAGYRPPMVHPADLIAVRDWRVSPLRVRCIGAFRRGRNHGKQRG